MKTVLIRTFSEVFDSLFTFEDPDFALLITLAGTMSEIGDDELLSFVET